MLVLILNDCRQPVRFKPHSDDLRIEPFGIDHNHVRPPNRSLL